MIKFELTRLIRACALQFIATRVFFINLQIFFLKRVREQLSSEIVRLKEKVKEVSKEKVITNFCPGGDPCK